MLAEHLSLRIQYFKRSLYGNSKKFQIALWLCNNPGEDYCQPTLKMEDVCSGS